MFRFHLPLASIRSCRRFTMPIGVVFTCVVVVALVKADEPESRLVTLPSKTVIDARKAIDRGLGYLRSTQEDDGGWTSRYGPAVTAIAARAFANDRAYGPKHPVVTRALNYILRFEQPDGGIYERGQNLANYQTSVVLMFLAEMKDPALEKRTVKAQAFLAKLQYDGGESIDPTNVWYGGAGYNSSKRPDLSNTQMMLEALRQSGLPKDHPVYQRALKFVSRSQMLGATNDQPFAKGATDGGFIYSPGDGGESKADGSFLEGAGRLRTYGSMTYAGFKSMLYADVSRDDPRIKACLDWIRRNWTLDQNPGMPGRQAQEGLYYYYHVFARALGAWGEPVMTDAAGKAHNWREELCGKIVSLQGPEGSWTNEKDRWLEGDANYVTGLTITTLQTALSVNTPPVSATSQSTDRP